MGKFKELSIEEQEKIIMENTIIDEFNENIEEKPLTQEEIDEMVTSFDEEEEEEINVDAMCSECGEHCEHSSLTGTSCCGANEAGFDTYDWSGRDE